MKKLTKLFVLGAILGVCNILFVMKSEAQVMPPYGGYYYVNPWPGSLSSTAVLVNIQQGSTQMFIDFYPEYGLQIYNASASGSIFYSSWFSGNRLYVTVDPNYNGSAYLYINIQGDRPANLGSVGAWSVVTHQSGYTYSGEGFGIRAPGPITGGGGEFYSVKTFPSPANEYVDVTVETPQKPARTEFVASKFQRQNFVEQPVYKVRIIDVSNGTEVNAVEVKTLNALPRIETSAYKAGTYSVVIEQNGKAISSSKFIVKH